MSIRGANVKQRLVSESVQIKRADLTYSNSHINPARSIDR